MARPFALALAIVASLVALEARAQEKPTEAAAPPKAAAAAAEPKKLEAVVHGLYIETRFGGGAMLLGRKLEGPLEGAESLGGGVLMQLGAGYDVTSVVALQFIGGSTLVSGKKRLRDLALYYGGVGARVSMALDERLNVVVLAGGAMARVDDAVEPAKTSPAVLATLGIEYYVHVRHFSIGLDASVLAPIGPMRLFLGLGPQLKYTF